MAENSVGGDEKVNELSTEESESEGQALKETETEKSVSEEVGTEEGQTDEAGTDEEQIEESGAKEGSTDEVETEDQSGEDGAEEELTEEAVSEENPAEEGDASDADSESDLVPAESEIEQAEGEVPAMAAASAVPDGLTCLGYVVAGADDIHFSIIFDIPDSMKGAGYYAKMTVGGDTDNAIQETVAEALADPYTYEDFTCGRFTATMAARQMADDVSLQFFDSSDNAVGSPYSFSVKECLEKIISGSSYSDSDKSIAAAMLNYGAAAQNYFNYHTDTLANAGLDDEKKTTVAVSASDIAAKVSGFNSSRSDSAFSVEDVSYGSEGKDQGSIEYLGMSLNLDTRPVLRTYYRLSGTNSTDAAGTISVKETVYYKSTTEAENAATFTSTAHKLDDSGTWYIETDPITAGHMYVQHNYTFNDQSGTELLTVKASPLNYIYKVLKNSSDSDLVNLCRSLYAYYLAADTGSDSASGSSGISVTPDAVKITWNANDGYFLDSSGNSAGKTREQLCRKGETVTALTADFGNEWGSRKFNGWYYDKTCANPVDFTTFKPTGDVTLYAGWKIDVTVKGATGGDSTDDTSAFNDAANSVDVANGVTTVYVPAGVYLIDMSNKHGVVLKYNGMRFEMENGAVLQGYNASTDTIDDDFILRVQAGTSNVEISGGEICGDHQNSSLSTYGKKEITRSSGNVNHGIYVTGASNVVISGVKVHNNYGDGIYVGEGLYYTEHRASKNVTIENCEVYQNKRNDISITRGETVRVSNCSIHNAGMSDSNSNVDPKIGILIESNDKSVYNTGITITGCTFTNNKGADVAVIRNGSMTVQNCTMTYLVDYDAHQANTSWNSTLAAAYNAANDGTTVKIINTNIAGTIYNATYTDKIAYLPQYNAARKAKRRISSSTASDSSSGSSNTSGASTADTLQELALQCLRAMGYLDETE